MGDNQQLLLGIDINEQFTQISAYQYSTNDAVSISMSADSANPLIPTCLLVKESTKEWAFGEEALKLKALNGGVYVDCLLTWLRLGESIEIYGSKFTPVMLLSKYFKKLLGVIRQRYLNSSIVKLVVTADDLNQSMMDGIYESLAMLGLERDRVMVLTRVQTFMYYILSQKQDLWLNDVGLFHFDDKGMFYYRMSINKRSTPNAVIVNKIDLSQEISASSFSKEEESRVAGRFETLVNQLLFKRLTTSLFFTGHGFVDDWADGVLKKLCVAHRVFKGQNLYTKGACYAAKALYQGDFKDYLFLSDEMTTSTIYLRLYQDAKEVEYPLAQAGQPWWTINESVTVILDDTSELQFTVANLLKRDPIKETFCLDGLRIRENKTIRLMIQLHFTDRDTAVVTVRDVGFGQFYETNHRIWEQILAL